MLYQKKNNTLEPLTGSTLYAETPIGTVIASFLAIAPSGYIKADDTVYTKAQYPELYERIPDVFKDTVNETFTIDLREVALKGTGITSNSVRAHISALGLELGEFIDDQLAKHAHVIPAGDVGSYAVGGVRRANDTATGPTGNVVTSGSSLNANVGDTTEVKSVGVNYFVKAKHVALPIDIMDAISEEYATKEYVDEVQVVDLSNYISSSVTLAANGAHAYIHGKHVEIVAHINKSSASTTGGFPAITGINGVIPMPKDDGFIAGSLYAAQGTNYYSGFCGYNKNSDSLGIYLTQAAAAGSYFQLNINYIGE